MKRLLYITDQQEYSERGTIGPLFNNYLKQHMNVNMVYVTKYKHSFQKKGEDFIVPIGKASGIVRYLEAKGVDIVNYDYIFVRNDEKLLRAVLKERSHFRYKVGFRISFPKTLQKEMQLKIENAFTNIFKMWALKYERYRKVKMINECDIFMPGSLQMRDEFFPGTTIKTFPMQVGIDPKSIIEHPQAGDVKRFIYIGTADALREIEVILAAFSNVHNDNWSLTFSTVNTDYVSSLLMEYSNIADKVTVKRSVTLKDVSEHIDDAEISLSLMPNIPIFDTFLPAKAVDGYTHTIPSILSENELNRSVFDEDEAFFTEFEPVSISRKIDEILEMTDDEISQVAAKGQKKLLSLNRNYVNMAEELTKELESL